VTAPPKPDPLRDPGTYEKEILGLTVPNLCIFVFFIAALVVILVAATVL
jgi:hypothetical protein